MKLHAILLLLLLLLGACTSDDISDERRHAASRLTLTLCFQMPSSRGAQVEGVEGKNENKITHLDIFLYPNGSDEDTPAAVRLSREFRGGEPVTKVEATLSEEEVKALYPYGEEECRVYAVANLQGASTPPDGLPSVRTLKSLVIAAENFNGNHPQSQFVMDNSGTETVYYDRGEQKLSGRLSLARSAAKISLTISSIKEVVEQDNEGHQIVWTANPEAMKVYMNRGVFRTHVDASLYPYAVEESDFYDTRHDLPVGYHEVTATLPGGGESKMWEPDVPFYSYPVHWSDTDLHRPFLILVVPWHKSTDGNNNYYNCYYQISVNWEGHQLLRNHYYKINLSVSTLGSFVEEKPVVVDPSYVILDWNTNTMDTQLEHYRYLMVNRDHVVLNNQEEVRIPYFTSHPAKIVRKKCTRPNLSENIVTIDEVSPSAYTLKLEDQNIVFRHQLNNNYLDDNFDFTPYTLTFRICHADQENYYQEVTLIQYPAIYAEADMNSDYRNDGSANNDNDHHGYTFVNGYYSDYYHYGLDRQDYFASVPGYVNRKGSPNMYVFTLSSVEGTDYIIGDPREKDVSDIVEDNVMYNGYSNRSAWVEAPSFEDGEVNSQKRRMKYYYATDNSKATRDMIAPKFRIASAYAVMHTNEYPARRLDAMKKRCASYQEDGYPAGRWRLPTQAEFQFIMSQVDKGMMPELYIRGASYWCAHGLGTPQGNGRIEMDYVNSSYYGYSTRCVYDEWYWEDKLDAKQKKHFTWGDKKR